MVNLDWFNFCNGTGKHFSDEQKAAGWPERFEVRILAAMQSEWSFDDKKSWPILDALQTVLTKSCKENKLVHLFESDPPPKERWRYFVTASDFAAWLALQHQVPSSSSAAWFAARGVDTKPQTAPAQPADTAPDPLVEAPAKRRTKHRTLWDVVTPYVVETIRAGQYASAKQLFKALETKAGQGSPFDKGSNSNRYSLFVREICEPLAFKTLQNKWPTLRTEAAKE